jgi:hypothetical protein
MEIEKKKRKKIHGARKQFMRYFRNRGFRIHSQSVDRITVISHNALVELQIVRIDVNRTQSRGLLGDIRIVVEEQQGRKLHISIFNIQICLAEPDRLSGNSDQAELCKRKLESTKEAKVYYESRVNNSMYKSYFFSDILNLIFGDYRYES